MYVFNDATLDSRVRREAATLASAGHRVTLMATSRPGVTTNEREMVAGYEIIRVPVPDAWRETWRNVATPWALRRRSVGQLKRAMLGGPRTWLGIPRATAGIGIAAGASAIRQLWLALSGGVRRRRATQWPPPTWYWAATWRNAILGWCREAADAAPAGDVHHGHDMTALSAALRAASRDDAPLVYDSHEIFLDSGANVDRSRWARMTLRYFERSWTRRAVALVTVNRAYARVLERRLRPPRTVVVHNCPPWRDVPVPAPSLLRTAAGVPDGSPIVLYHGAFSPNRGLEELAEAMLEPGLGDAHLVYLGYGALRDTVRRIVTEPKFQGRLHVLPAVPPDELLDWVAGADVDAIPLQHSSLNHYLCTPNKLFESLTAGVPVVISDFPVMREIVRDDPGGPLGEACEPREPGSIGLALRVILDLDPGARAALRGRCLTAARERWNWERESTGLIELYADLAERRSVNDGDTTRTR